MRSKKAPPNPHDTSQEDRFASVARELGCDEDEAAFKEKLAVIGRRRPAAPAASSINRGRSPKRARKVST